MCDWPAQKFQISSSYNYFSVLTLLIQYLLKSKKKFMSLHVFSLYQLI